MDTELLGLRLRQARELRGMTLAQVAEAVGLNKSTVQRYEKCAIRSPKAPVVESFAKALDVSPAWLMGESADMTDVYGDPELTKYLDMLENRRDCRMLLDVAQGATVQEIQAIVSFIEGLRRDER